MLHIYCMVIIMIPNKLGGVKFVQRLDKCADYINI